MRNLDWLYQTNSMFRETVNQGAAQWMGSDSPVFAGEWLLREHEPEQSDYDDLRGQHLDGPCVVPDAAKLRISQFVAQEMWKTAESDAAKSEIRGFADNRSEVGNTRLRCNRSEVGNTRLRCNREELVDRITDMVNAKIDERDTGELVSFARRLESAAESGDDVTLFGVDYVPAANAEYLDNWDSSSVADLLHQYEDGKLMRDCDVETHVLIETEELQSIAEKYREDAIAAQKELENTKRAMNRAAGKWAKADADATEWMHIIDCLEDRIAVRDKSIERLERQRDEASAERDAYRDLCGRMRKVANEMLCMEVD